MKYTFLFAILSLFLFSCSGPEFWGNSDEGQIVGKYKTMLSVDNYLYAVNNSQLITFDMTDKANPVEIDKKDVGEDIENLYETEKVLFIGSQTNLHIYDLKSNGIPVEASSTPYVNFGDEITVCDPVAATNDIAYVTLSSSFWINDGGCPTVANVNEIRSYDVKDIENPIFVSSRQMENPQGLSIDGDYIFVSEGNTGFNVYKIDHTGNMDYVTSNYDGSSYDLFAKDGKLLVVSEEEIRQYDYSDINNIILYSKLELR